MKFKWTLLVLLLSIVNLHAQLTKIDSLRLQLKSATGNKRVDLLMDITKRNYKNDIKEAKEFIKEAEGLSKSYLQGQVKVLYNKSRVFIFENNDYKSAIAVMEEALAISKKNGFKDYLKDIYIRTSMLKRDGGDMDGAINLLNEAVEFSNTINDRAYQAEVSNSIGSIAYLKGDLAKAIDYFTKAAKLYEEVNNLTELAGNFMNIGVVNFNVGKNDESLKWYYKALKINQQLKDSLQIANTMENIALTKSRMGNDTSAQKDFKVCIEIYKAVRQNRFLANCYDNLGMTYMNLGQTDMALKCAIEGATIKEKEKDIRGLGISYRNMATMYAEIKQMNKAIEYHSKALEYAKQAQDDYLREQVLYALGGLYRKLNDLEKAEKCVYESMEIAKRIGDMPGYSNSLMELGSITKSKKDLKKAIVYYTEALKIKEQTEEKHSIAELLNNIGESYYELKNYLEAINYLSRALKLRTDANNLIGLSTTYEKMAFTYSALNDYKNAFKYHVMFHSTWDSVYNSKISQQMTEMNTKYESAQKDKEITQRKAAEKEALLKAEKESEQRKNTENKLLFSIIGISLMLILVGVVIYGNIQRKKTNEKLATQNEEIQLQKHIIEEKQKEILDSINYAKRIQYTLLAHTDFLQENIPNHFVYFNPKDIVSGDFYWATKRGNKFYIAVCDSTGHGVPGAFMSLLNISFLNEAVNEKGIEEPNKVFDFVRQRLIDNISKEGQKDGFDGILVCIETLSFPKGNPEGSMMQKEKTSSSSKGPGVRVTYAAANNAPVLIAGASTGSATAQFIELASDRMPVGMGERKENFKLFTIDAKQGDSLYLYTDGYADQFGGPKGKKFKYKPLNELILTNHKKTLHEQKEILKTTFENWRGDLEQVDDVCIIGIRL